MIQVYPDLEILSDVAAEVFALYFRKAVEQRGIFRVALAGGSTPRRMYEILAGPDYKSRLPWERAHIFWGDERCVPADDARSNQRMAREMLLDRVPVPKNRIFSMDCADNPEKAAANYENLLKEQFQGDRPRFDLVILGLGENGHTASLFPGTPVLNEKEHWVAAVHVAGQDFARLTLTLPVINKSRVILFLVSGRKKSEVFRQVIEGTTPPESLPVLLVKPEDGQLRWLVDREASRHIVDRSVMLQRQPSM